MRKKNYNDSLENDVELFLVVVFVEYLGDDSEIVMNPFSFLIYNKKVRWVRL